MRFARATLSIASVLVLALVAALPWNGSDSVRVALPLVPMAGIIFWTLHQPSSLPALAVFFCGITIDILMQAPLGFWALIALVAALFVRIVKRYSLTPSLLVRAIVATSALALTSSSSWALASAYTLERIALQPHVIAIPFAIGGYVLVGAVLTVLDTLVSGVPPRQLLGGGD